MSTRTTCLQWLLASATLLSVTAQASTLITEAPTSSAPYSPADGSGRVHWVTMDSALAGLALSNGTANPFVTPATSTEPASGLISALNFGGITFKGDAHTTVSEGQTRVSVGRTDFDARFTTTVQPLVTSVTFDTTTGGLLSAQLGGGFTLESRHLAGVVDDGTMSLSDLRLDFKRRVLTADVRSNPGTSLFKSAEDMDVFSIRQLTGVSGLAWGQAVREGLASGGNTPLVNQGWTLQPQLSVPDQSLAMTGWLEASGLEASGSFRAFMLDALGASTDTTHFADAIAALNASSAQDGGGWGTLRMGLGLRMTILTPSAPIPMVTLDPAQLLKPVNSAVPEPSANAMVLLGLASLGLAAARRRRAH